MNKEYQYILWDLDGTISNTYEGVCRSLAPAFEAYGIEWEGDYSCFIGPPMRESLPRYAHVPADCLEDVIAKFRQRYRTVGVYECELFPGVAETVAALHAAGRVQALSSSKPEAQCLVILRRFGLIDCFDEIVGASLDGTIDSKDEVLSETFRRLAARDPEFRPADCVLIGDTQYDAEGARAAGIDCIGVSYGFGGREELLSHGVTAVVDSPAALLAEWNI